MIVSKSPSKTSFSSSLANFLLDSLDRVLVLQELDLGGLPHPDAVLVGDLEQVGLVGVQFVEVGLALRASVPGPAVGDLRVVVVDSRYPEGL